DLDLVAVREDAVPADQLDAQVAERLVVERDAGAAAAAEQRTAAPEDDVQADAERGQIDALVLAAGDQRGAAVEAAAHAEHEAIAGDLVVDRALVAEAELAGDRERYAAGERHARQAGAVARVEIAQREAGGGVLDLGVLARHAAGAQRQVAQRIAAQDDLARGARDEHRLAAALELDLAGGE